MITRTAICVVAISLVIMLVGSVMAGADANNWRIVLQATAGNIANVGNVYVGAVTGSTDIKDSADNFLPPLNDPNVQLYELRNDWQGGSKVKSDFRAPYTNATKVWNNFFISSTAPLSDSQGNPTVITLSWEVGTNEYALPTGSYKMVVSFATGVTDVDYNDLSGVHEYDISTNGSVRFLPTDATSVQASARIICTVGNGPALFKTCPVTASGTGVTVVHAAPVLDEAGLAFTAADNARIYKIDTTADPMTITTLTNPSGSIKGRLASYGGFVYGIGNTGALNKRAKSGTTGNATVTAAGGTVGSTPAVVADGSIYVGAGNFLKKFSSTGAAMATSADLGGAVGSPSIPGTELVWVNAGNKLYCLNSDLSTIRAASDPMAAAVGAPAAFTWYDRVVATGGDKVFAFSLTGLLPIGTYTAGGTITTSPFVNPETNSILFGADDHCLYDVNIMSLTDVVAKKTLPGAGAIYGNAVVGAQYIAIAGGKADLTSQYDSGDYNVYLVNKTTGAVTFIGVNQATLGCVAGLDGHIYFTSTDGNLYVIE